MRGLDIIGADAFVGVSWGDVGDAGKWGFGNVVHPLGKGIATAFGAGAAAQSLENVEVKQGWLPATPTSTASTITSSVESVAAKNTKTKDDKKDATKDPTKKDDVKDATKTATDAKPSAAQQQPSSLGRAVAIAGAVGVFGIVALILRRVWRG